jgi:hypothetical protein
MYEYYLKFWGQGEKRVAEKMATTKTEYWFPTKEDRRKFKKKVYDYSGDHTIVFKEEEGDSDFVRKRTVVIVDAVFKGEKYNFEYDYGYAYKDENAEYMFEDGNYSCNCNLSRFIKDKYPDFPELDCLGDDEGNEIDYDFRIVHRD